MREAFDGIEKEPHPEEPALAGVSKDARWISNTPRIHSQALRMRKLRVRRLRMRPSC